MILRKVWRLPTISISNNYKMLQYPIRKNRQEYGCKGCPHSQGLSKKTTSHFFPFKNLQLKKEDERKLEREEDKNNIGGGRLQKNINFNKYSENQKDNEEAKENQLREEKELGRKEVNKENCGECHSNSEKCGKCNSNEEKEECPEVGQIYPNFEGLGIRNGKVEIITQETFNEKNILLLFYLSDFNKICEEELVEFSQLKSEFDKISQENP